MLNIPIPRETSEDVHVTRSRGLRATAALKVAWRHARASDSFIILIVTTGSVKLEYGRSMQVRYLRGYQSPSSSLSGRLYFFDMLLKHASIEDCAGWCATA